MNKIIVPALLIVDETLPTEPLFRIRPHDIPCKIHLPSMESFESFVTKVIILFCQAAGKWIPFTEAELNQFAEELNPPHELPIGECISLYLECEDRGFFVERGDERYLMTIDFISYVYHAALTVKS